MEIKSGRKKLAHNRRGLSVSSRFVDEATGFAQQGPMTRLHTMYSTLLSTPARYNRGETIHDLQVGDL